MTLSGALRRGQLLVTPRDFRDPSFKANLRETTEELLNMARVVPVFNENDAISDRTRVCGAEVRRVVVLCSEFGECSWLHCDSEISILASVCVQL